MKFLLLALAVSAFAEDRPYFVVCTLAPSTPQIVEAQKKMGCQAKALKVPNPQPKKK